MKKFFVLLMTLALLGTMAFLTGCDSPEEEAMEERIEDAGEAMEEKGEEMQEHGDEAMEEAGEEMEEMGDEMEDQADEMADDMVDDEGGGM